jgi:hypothetical protein
MAVLRVSSHQCSILILIMINAFLNRRIHERNLGTLKFFFFFLENKIDTIVVLFFYDVYPNQLIKYLASFSGRGI